MLLVFEDQVIIPFWLQPIGRMHPVVLHFPIGFIVLLVLVNIFGKQLQEESFKLINKSLLLLTAFSTVLAAIMGIFLSHEEGYTSSLLSLHKWIGVAVAYLMYVLTLVYHQKKTYNIVLYTSFFAIVIAGHFGAELTHGTNFITEPIINNNKPAFDANQPLFVSTVKPILESRCENCHNADKHKGDLDLSSLEKIHNGGKNGPLWVSGNPDSSHIIQRALLPLEHKKHMPPQGKAQLTNLELQLLQAWISSGADEEVTVAQLSKADTLYLLAQQISTSKSKDDKPRYAFAFADPDLITSLNNPYRTVIQHSSNSPAIDVTIYGKDAFNIEYLTELSSIKDQIVSLKIAYMPVSDEVFDIVGTFKNLETLNLNFTNIIGENISALNQCNHLRSLSLSGTNINADQLQNLKDNKQLEEIFVWNTSITPSEATELSESLNIASIEYGYTPDPEEKLTLPPPTLLNDKNLIAKGDPVILTNKFSSVQIRYTEDGSEPDSTSTIYSEPLFYDKNIKIKARSYQDGWLPSGVSTFNLIQKGVKPKAIELLYPPGNKYTGGSALLLVDDEQGRSGDLPFLSWAGFYDTPFSVIADLGDESPALKYVALSYGTFDRDKATQPSSVEVWGGDDKESMRLISKMTPEIDKGNRTSKIIYLDVRQSQYRYYQIKAYSFDKLPDWHRRKGEKGSLLIDQIFFYTLDPRKPEPKVLAQNIQ